MAVLPSAGSGDTEIIRWCVDRALKNRESQVRMLFRSQFFLSCSSYGQKKYLFGSSMS